MIDKEDKQDNREYIEYEVTEKDLIEAYENDLKKPVVQGCLLYYLAFQVFFVIYGGVLMLLYFMDAPAPILLLSILAIPVACFLLVIQFSRRRRAVRSVKKRLKRREIEPQYIGRHRLELNEDGTELRYGTICVRRQYAGIQKIMEYPCGIMVYNSQLDKDIIPSSAFVDAQQRRVFLNHLQAKIAQAKNTGISEQSAEEHNREASYVLEYTWDEASFINAMTRANNMMFKTRLAWTRGRIALTLFGLLFCMLGLTNVIMAFMEMHSFYRDGFALMPGGICIGVGLGCLLPLIMAFTPLGRKLYRKHIESGAIPRDFFSTQSLCLKEDKITELRRLSSFDVTYGRVYCVRYNEEGIYIFLNDMRFLIIPSSAFPSDDLKRKVVDFIEMKSKEYANNPRKD